MRSLTLRERIGFFENELTNNILFFWLPRCLDPVYEGFFNCFDNTGKTRVSTDKYTWSQGRFVWLFSRLAMMERDLFTREQRDHFLLLAKKGRDFLEQHVLIAPDDWRCVFLMDQTGRPLSPDGSGQLDYSIYADCFVVEAFARYALASGDTSSYDFATQLYRSVLNRVQTGAIQTHPYPLSSSYRAHGIPMILLHITCEVLLAAQRFNAADVSSLKQHLRAFYKDILDHFVDEHHVVHEVIRSDNRFLDNRLGQHANPGHTLECMWFLLEASEQLGMRSEENLIGSIVQKTCSIGWDETYGGLLHYCDVTGGLPIGEMNGVQDEPMLHQVNEGWSDKLWWVHSEALYTTLLCWNRTHNTAYLELYEQIFNYTFKTFPNPDREIREWIQIRQRDGSPQDKVVALPVKDPYHIARNCILIIELLDRILNET